MLMTITVILCLTVNHTHLFKFTLKKTSDDVWRSRLPQRFSQVNSCHYFYEFNIQLSLPEMITCRICTDIHSFFVLIAIFVFRWLYIFSNLVLVHWFGNLCSVHEPLNFKILHFVMCLKKTNIHFQHKLWKYISNINFENTKQVIYTPTLALNKCI